jgi:hypothetical protein
VAPGRPRAEAPPRAAKGEPEEKEGNPPRCGGEHKHHHQSDQSQGQGHGDHEPGAEQCGLRNRAGPPTRAPQEDMAVPREVTEQPRKVAVGSGTEGSVYALL